MTPEERAQSIIKKLEKGGMLDCCVSPSFILPEIKAAIRQAYEGCRQDCGRTGGRMGKHWADQSCQSYSRRHPCSHIGGSMTPEEEKFVFKIWDTGNRPYPAVAEAILRARNAAYEDAARIAETTIPQGHPTVYGQEIAAAIRARVHEKR
jgi:hypothetical protein